MTAPVLLAALAWCTGTLGAVVLVAGWLDAGGSSFVSWSPARLFLSSAFFGILARRLARESFPQDALRREPLGRILLAALLVAFAAVSFATGVDSVGGADSAGYLAQANRWRQGELRQRLSLADLPVHDPAWLQSPLGFRPSPLSDATVPTYPPGLPLLQAVALTGGHAVAVRGLPAACALLALAALYRVSRATLSPSAAILATAAAASSPPFLFQALQPMSDVPALAAWLVAMAALVQGGAAGRTVAAFVSAIAVAIRPNLAPLLLVIGWMAARGAPSLRAGVGLAAPVLAPAIVSIASVVVLQATLYGSPWLSGYGSASELFSLRHLAVNIGRQLAWIAETHAWPAVVWLLVGVAALAMPSVVPRPLAAAAVVVWFLYLCYLPFDNWTYLRFVLLPLALINMGASGLLAFLVARRRPAVQLAALTAALTAVVATNVVMARRLGVFDLHNHEARFKLAATFVREHTPPDAVVLAAQHSGAIAAYTDRAVLRLDLLRDTDAASLVLWLRAHHRPVVVVLDDDERRRMTLPPGVDELSLDWPARAHVGAPARTRVWLVDDRARFRAGESIPRTVIWPPRR